MVLQTYQILAEIFRVSISLHVAGKIKELICILDYLNIPLGCWVQLVFRFLIFYQYWQNNY